VSVTGLKSYLTYRWQHYWDKHLYEAAGPLLVDRREPDINIVLDAAKPYMERNIGGEAISIIGRTITFAEQGAAMVVNCAPFGCMPGTITTAISRHIAAVHHMPVVNMFYDGQGNQNRRLEVFLKNAVARPIEPGRPARAADDVVRMPSWMESLLSVGSLRRKSAAARTPVCAGGDDEAPPPA
jgi:hypothetical protein